VSIGLLIPALASAEDVERRINTWLVAGTYPCENQAAFEDDAVDPASAIPAAGADAAGKPWRVMDDRLYCRNLDDFVDLYTFFSPVREGSPGEATDKAAAYAHTWVWSSEAQEVQVLLGANDGYRMWLNGELLASEYDERRYLERDGESISGRLQAGWNRLLLKIHNGQGIWGFYCKLADESGAALEGLEYSIAAPEAELRVVTDALPTGYNRLPYVWLAIQDVAPADRVPSASPFRLQAAGGTPPYHWKVAADTLLPSGLWLDGPEGELRGILAAEPGEHTLRLVVEDAAGNQDTVRFTLNVEERPTLWLEKGRLAGLIHGVTGYTPNHGDPQWHARLLAREGYAVAYPTTAWLILPENWPGSFDEETFRNSPDVAEKMAGKPARHQDMSAFVEAFESHGVRFGSYIGLPDNVPTVFKEGVEHDLWPAYLDALHQHMEDLCVEYSPAALYLDGAHRKVEDQYDWCFDAIYSVAKTLYPPVLIMPNLATHDDFGGQVGDADVVSVEGANDSLPYWPRWPDQMTSSNPKFVPVATWRYPFSWEMWEGTDRMQWYKEGDPYTYIDWQEWMRVMVSVIGEGYICDLDHTVGYGREEMHEQIAAWLEPRKQAIIGTFPGPLEDADWGYDLEKEGVIYLHLLENPRGKKGLAGRKEIVARPLDREVAAVRVFPDGADLSFEQKNGELTIAVSDLEADPVATILEVSFK